PFGIFIPVLVFLFYLRPDRSNKYYSPLVYPFILIPISIKQLQIIRLIFYPSYLFQTLLFRRKPIIHPI
uniref:Uncharacterized protein n=1 Tax=Oryza brachyantha TaxID=4533 RepID=J3MP30_ORYBR